MVIDHLEVRRPPGCAPATWIGLLPTSVTLPGNVWSGIASIVTFAGWPSAMNGMSVSSTSISAWTPDMSAIDSRSVPPAERAVARRFALFDQPLRDDAGDRRDDSHLREIDLRAREVGLFLLDALLLRDDRLLGALEIGRLRS